MQRIAGPVPETWTFEGGSNSWFVASRASGSNPQVSIYTPRRPKSVNITMKAYNSSLGSGWQVVDQAKAFVANGNRVVCDCGSNIAGTNTTVLVELNGTITF